MYPAHTGPGSRGYPAKDQLRGVLDNKHIPLFFLSSKLILYFKSRSTQGKEMRSHVCFCFVLLLLGMKRLSMEVNGNGSLYTGVVNSQRWSWMFFALAKS